MKVTGIVLIILGIIALIYGGITYTTHKKVLDIGPIQAEKKETHNIPLPPVLGVVVIVGGSALLLFAAKAADLWFDFGCLTPPPCFARATTYLTHKKKRRKLSL